MGKWETSGELQKAFWSLGWRDGGQAKNECERETSCFEVIRNMAEKI